MNEEFINDRFLGTIFGQAVGDALGLSTEFMSKQEVGRFYPNGIEDYSQIVQDDHRRRWQRGDWTDDTDMMLCILDSFVACQKVDTLDIARRFKEWMMNGGMGIGRHTYNVMALDDYTSNPQKAAEIIWKMGKKKAAANGAVMRTSVVGLLKDNVANAAVAGAILGAKFGICHIPDEWRNGLLYVMTRCRNSTQCINKNVSYQPYFTGILIYQCGICDNSSSSSFTFSFGINSHTDFYSSSKSSSADFAFNLPSFIIFTSRRKSVESCRHHCQQDSLSKTEPKSLPCNFYLCNIYYYRTRYS